MGEADRDTAGRDPTGRDVPPLATGMLAGVAGAVAVLLLAVAGRYGYHRDELYFLACGRHPAWGYPDQPPLTPLLAAGMDRLGAGSLVVFRLPALICATGIALLTGCTARELGGGRWAQGLAAAAVGTGTMTLLSGHLLLTSTVDLLVWVTVAWLVARMLRTDDDRLWVAIGAVIAVGLLNKQLPVVLAFGLLAGMALTPPARHLLRSRWLAVGAILALAAWAPVLAWQATNGWPQLTLAGQIRREYGTPGQRIAFVVFQLLLYSLGATYLWVTGALALWPSERASQYRVLVWTGLVVLAVLVLTAGQLYYPAGVYPVLIAAGAVAVERSRRRRRVVLAAVLVSAAVPLPAILPLLPAHTLGSSPWSGLGEPLRESVGWPGLVDQVAAAYKAIPPAERGRAGIYATNYGEAGAIDRYGPSRGLPPAWSGHNGYGWWGPPPAGLAPVVVVWEDGTPDRYFTGCVATGRIRGPVDNEETERAAVFLCTGVRGGWAAAWPRLRHLSA